ncbi:CPBP family intramembrane glutamic endopeptidase [Paractinoplanes hotanensis]|uniref:CPBP family intramembrane metalloprotease n=1 Tax=Paractinoplanes hotanensis TaxID=2906497 RepID=A0ABT0Y5R3_9ACTN|nr:CPBP family intramembrane glutamic endopeptidase [Actinoplanes hotanensis]MCM4081367.1 CPBP family intramembrane metalloprotease [Actinoplanes hotanensis]
MAPLILSALFVLVLLTDVFVGTARTKRILDQVRADPASRVRFYRAAVVSGWARAAVAMLVVVTASFTGPETPGWDLPELPTLGMPAGALIAWLLAGWVTLTMVIGGFRLRKRMRAGHQPPGRAQIAVLVPRTDRERRFAAALSVTAGVTEEVVFRYALIALGIKVFHLPTVAAVVLSLLLFVGIHAYQGRLGMVNSAVLGSVFTFLTLLSGSLLPAILLHIAIDLNALLLVPAEPTPPNPETEPRPRDPEAQPTPQEPAARPAAHPITAGDGTDPAAGRPVTAESPALAAPRIRPPIPAE